MKAVDREIEEISKEISIDYKSFSKYFHLKPIRLIIMEEMIKKIKDNL